MFTYRYQINDDYRQGTKIDEIDEIEIDEWTCEVKLDLPDKGYRTYLICDFPKYTPISYWDETEKIDAHDYADKVFSLFHGCLPFVVNGMGDGYKDLGEYPDIPEKIQKIKLPNQLFIEELVEKLDSEYYFLLILDKDGEYKFTIPVVP